MSIRPTLLLLLSAASFSCVAPIDNTDPAEILLEESVAQKNEETPKVLLRELVRELPEVGKGDLAPNDDSVNITTGVHIEGEENRFVRVDVKALGNLDGGGEYGESRERGGLGLYGTGRGGGGIGSGEGIGRLAGRGKGGGLSLTDGRGQGYIPPRSTESSTTYRANNTTETSVDKFSTFSIDVDTGSYTIARKKLNSEILPPASSVRPEEFLNYFTYAYPSPKNEPFNVHVEGAPSPFSTSKEKYILRIGLQGQKIEAAERKPVHLTFLVDVSGSMAARDKLVLAKKSLRVLVKNLKDGDTVAMSTYAGRVAQILAPTGIKDRKKILRAINTLRSGGGTRMSSGMESAYKSAMKNFKKNHVNRVIVLSDGDANIGPKSHQEILNRIHHFAEEGISLSTIGFGMGNYNDTMMEQLANKGNGNYYYVDSLAEAKKIFGKQINGTLQIIAKDVKIQVEFNPDRVKNYRLIGYENRDIADKDFRNDRVDAGEIGAGHSVTALYEITLQPGKNMVIPGVLGEMKDDRLATLRIRAKKPGGQVAKEQHFSITTKDIQKTLSETSKDFQFQIGVVEFAEILRKSSHAEGLTLALVKEVLRPAVGDSKERKELLNLVERAMRLSPKSNQ